MMAYYIAIIVASIPMYGFLMMLLDKAKTDVKVRNDLLAFAYLIRDIGPSVSSVSVVGIVVAGKEDQFNLIVVFLLGILCSYFGRKLRDIIFVRTKTEPAKKSLVSFAKESSNETPRK